MPESPRKRLPYRIKSQQRGTHTMFGDMLRALAEANETGEDALDVLD
ncbi:MAG: hypothetical protein JOZ26_02260, partial [Hyphomicrobiales bacterium]|nr:hypothetical protein [Hyphomicrobiales bacterium]